MSIQLGNFVSTTLAEAVAPNDTEITVSSATGFPTLGFGDWCYLVLVRSVDGAREIVKATAISGADITVERGQEGTTALAFVAGDAVKLAFTAQTLLDAAAFPMLSITVEKTTYTATVKLQVSTAGYFRIHTWLIDQQEPTTQHSVNPPDSSDLVAWDAITDADGYAELDITHMGAEQSWWLCAELCGRLYVSDEIKLGS